MREALKKIEAEDAEKATRTVPLTPKPPAGWYPHPTMAGTQRYWDGERWTDTIAPTPASDPRSAKQQSQVLGAVLIAGSAIGLIMSLQSASLLTGTGAIWTGVAIAIGAAIVTWMVDAVPTWVSVLCVLAALIATSNAVSVESQLDRQRHKIDRMLN
jgi:hypothetical protein